MADFFQVFEKNPNNRFGGGGCLASGARQGEDCSGKWVHFHRVSTEHDASPFAVICEYHLNECIDQLPFEEVDTTEGDELPLPLRVPNEPTLPPAETTPYVPVPG